MKAQYTSIILFTTYNEIQSESKNQESFIRLKKHLTDSDIAFREVVGVNMNGSEPTLVVDAQYEDLVVEVCTRRSQDYYIHLDMDRNAYYVDPNTGQRRKVGVFKGVASNHKGEYFRDVDKNINYAIV